MDERLLLPERTPQNADQRLLIRTTDALGSDCRELAQKTGCNVETVVSDILSVGYKSVKALADGKSKVVISMRDGKLVVESFKVI